MQSKDAFADLQTAVTGMGLARNAMEQKRLGHGKLCASCQKYHHGCWIKTWRESHPVPMQCKDYEPENKS
jgi:hypothetical protein